MNKVVLPNLQSIKFLQHFVIVTFIILGLLFVPFPTLAKMSDTLGTMRMSDTTSTLKLGNLYNIRKKYDSALLFMNRSLEINSRRKDSFDIAQSLNNVGAVEIKLKKLKEAKHHFKQALVIAKKKNFLLLEVFSLENLGYLYGDTATDFYKIDTAIELYSNAMGIAKKIDNEAYLLKALNALQNLYALKGRYHKAFDFAKQYQVLSDTIYFRESDNQLKQIKIRFKIKQREKELLESQQKAKRIKLISIIISLLLAIIIGILYLI